MLKTKNEKKKKCTDEEKKNDTRLFSESARLMARGSLSSSLTISSKFHVRGWWWFVFRFFPLALVFLFLGRGVDSFRLDLRNNQQFSSFKRYRRNCFIRSVFQPDRGDFHSRLSVSWRCSRPSKGVELSNLFNRAAARARRVTLDCLERGGKRMRRCYAYVDLEKFVATSCDGVRELKSNFL